MDIKNIDQELIQIIDKRNRLEQLNYNDEQYDVLEEELHDLEDEWVDKYGDFVEKAVEEVHKDHCPDSEILNPIAYVGKKYVETTSKDDTSRSFDVAPNQGILVDADKYPNALVRLVLIPGPMRLVLQIGSSEQKEVWTARDN